MKIDLHTHTYYSDGILSPKELVNLAVKREIKILAITDHDTISGVEEAIKFAKNKNIKVIPGIEISAVVKCSKDPLHIVGLYIDSASIALKNFLNKITDLKEQKTAKRLELINKYFNADISYEDLKAKTRGNPGLPHIAMVLFDKSYTNSIEEGIKLMTKGGACYTDLSSKTISSKEAIKIIHNSKGIVILAHLAAYKNVNKFVTFEAQEQLVKELVNYGIDGLEIYIPDITNKEIAFEKRLAKKYSLHISIGSDFHDEKLLPQNKLGFLDIKKEKITVLRN